LSSFTNSLSTNTSTTSGFSMNSRIRTDSVSFVLQKLNRDLSGIVSSAITSYRKWGTTSEWNIRLGSISGQGSMYDPWLKYAVTDDGLSGSTREYVMGPSVRALGSLI